MLPEFDRGAEHADDANIADVESVATGDESGGDTAADGGGGDAGATAAAPLDACLQAPRSVHHGSVYGFTPPGTFVAQTFNIASPIGTPGSGCESTTLPNGGDHELLKAVVNKAVANEVNWIRKELAACDNAIKVGQRLIVKVPTLGSSKEHVLAKPTQCCH